MQAERTRYAVSGWGTGELWTGPDVVLAHDFRFQPVSDTGVPDDELLPRPDLVYAATHAAAKPPAHPASPCGAIDTVSERLPLDRKRCLTPEDLVERFAAFLAGEAVDFADVPLDLSSTSPFQRDVAETLRSVPRGDIVTYGELAALAGYPNAQRAVGTFCARNHFMFLLPCHRVVAANGIGSYGSAGVTVKRRLLALEGVAL